MTGSPDPAPPVPPAPAPTAIPPDLRPGEVVEVAAGVRRVVAPNPGMMTGPGTNTYLIGTDRLTLVDPGPADDAHLKAILAAVAGAGAAAAGGRLQWILVTHTHVDHSPLAARLKAETGAEVLAYGDPPAAQPPGLDAHDLDFRPDRRLANGDQLVTPDYRLTAVHTPGHAANHLCFDLDGVLFSGDHVMSGSTVVIAPPDGDMAEYLDSLHRVRSRVPARIAPGHGAMIDDPLAILDDYLAHRRQREAQVVAGLAAVGGAGTTTEALVAEIYQAVPAELHPVARYSVWAHLRMLAAEGRAVATAVDELDARWWAPASAPPSAPPPITTPTTSPTTPST